MGKYWQKSRLENIGKYWQMSKILEKYWKMGQLENIGKILTKNKLENIENYWQTWKYWKMSQLENIKWFAISELTIYQFFKRCYKIAFWNLTFKFKVIVLWSVLFFTLFHFYKIRNEQFSLKHLDLNTFLKKLYFFI